jgi:hypothetical protein
LSFPFVSKRYKQRDIDLKGQKQRQTGREALLWGTVAGQRGGAGAKPKREKGKEMMLKRQKSCKKIFLLIY